MYVCKNDDKRKDNPGNLLTSIAPQKGFQIRKLKV